MRSRYSHYNSFYNKTLVVLCLLAIIPLLLVIHVIVSENIDITDRMILITALAFMSILVGYIVLRRAADKLVRLAVETSKIKSGDSMEMVEIEAEQEFNEIASHFNEALRKLERENKEIKEQSVQLMIYARDLTQSYKKTKEEEALRTRLSRYVGENLVEKIINTKDGVFFESERQEVTVFFADIRSFTSLAENMDAEEVVSVLNEFFSVMVDIVFAHEGVLDKFVGDQIMAVFGLLKSEENAAQAAVATAIEMQRATEELMARWKTEERATFKIGIGINTGTAIIGNVGSEKRMDFTVIGDCVNVASRFEKEAKGGEIIVGEQTYQESSTKFVFESRGGIDIRNKTLPVDCYAVLR
jgi:adenylate cyclase